MSSEFQEWAAKVRSALWTYRWRHARRIAAVAAVIVLHVWVGPYLGRTVFGPLPSRADTGIRGAIVNDPGVCRRIKANTNTDWDYDESMRVRCGAVYEPGGLGLAGTGSDVDDCTSVLWTEGFQPASITWQGGSHWAYSVRVTGRFTHAGSLYVVRLPAADVRRICCIVCEQPDPQASSAPTGQ